MCAPSVTVDCAEESLLYHYQRIVGGRHANFDVNQLLLYLCVDDTGRWPFWAMCEHCMFVQG